MRYRRPWIPVWATLCLWLAGCSTSTQSALPQTRSAATSSWILPAAKSKSLLYVSNTSSLQVTIYTYDSGNGLNLVGSLSGFTNLNGICVDKKGNVYVPTRATHGEKVYKYAHGGTQPIATFSTYLGQPLNCAVSPTTGDVAVMNLQSHYYGFAITVWPNGNPANKPIRYVEYGYNSGKYLAYDNTGRLYFDDGFSDLYVLTGGSMPFTRMTVRGATLHSDSALQWGNPNLLVGDFNGTGTSVAYRLQISGTTATVVGTVPFVGSSNIFGFWKVANKIVAADNGANSVGIYNFPAGSLYASLTSGISSPYSAVVSQ